MQVVDVASGRLILFNGYGGNSGGGELTGTWEFDGSTWTQPFPDAPGQRDSASVAYDPIGERIVAYGGDGRSCDNPNHCDATLEYVLAPE